MEKEFRKEVYGAFTGSVLGEWLDSLSVREVLIVGFYTHGCVSTTAREAIMRGYSVWMDPDGTSSFSMEHERLGKLSADEVCRSALLHLVNMGAQLCAQEYRYCSDPGQTAVVSH